MTVWTKFPPGRDQMKFEMCLSSEDLPRVFSISPKEFDKLFCVNRTNSRKCTLLIIPTMTLHDWHSPPLLQGSGPGVADPKASFSHGEQGASWGSREVAQSWIWLHSPSGEAAKTFAALGLWDMDFLPHNEGWWCSFSSLVLIVEGKLSLDSSRYKVNVCALPLPTSPQEGSHKRLRKMNMALSGQACQVCWPMGR